MVVAQAFEEAGLRKKTKDKEDTMSKKKYTPYSSLPPHWFRLNEGMLKCKLSASWSNEVSMIGGAWIVRDSRGEVLFHAREDFTTAYSRLEAELKVIEWMFRSLCDLHLQDVEV